MQLYQRRKFSNHATYTNNTSINGNFTGGSLGIVIVGGMLFTGKIFVGKEPSIKVHRAQKM